MYDEQQVIGFIDEIIDAFAAAGRIPTPVPSSLRENLHGLVFIGRMQSDVDGGMTYSNSRAKHLSEVVATLGGNVSPSGGQVPPVEPFHVPPAAPTFAQFRAVVFTTAQEFPALTAEFTDDAPAGAAALELLRRVIWHLRQAGFERVGRQRNPSGSLSGDKICVVLDDGAWHAFDIMTLGYASHATRIAITEVGSPNPQDDDGISDGQ
jgi:hypothetical protein